MRSDREERAMLCRVLALSIIDLLRQPLPEMTRKKCRSREEFVRRRYTRRVYNQRLEQQRDSARSWFYGGGDSTEPFSVGWYCEEIGIDYQAMMAQIETDPEGILRRLKTMESEACQRR